MQAVANRYPQLIISMWYGLNRFTPHPVSDKHWVAMGQAGLGTGLFGRLSKAENYFRMQNYISMIMELSAMYLKHNGMLEIVNILKRENLIDGIGIQCHERI